MGRTKYKDCECFLEYINVKDNLIEYKCLCYNKNFQKSFDFFARWKQYRFHNHDINILMSLLLQKGIYSYKYMDDRERFNEPLLPEKEDFYSHLNMEDISDADYTYAKRVCKDFKIKKLGEYYNFFLNVINGSKRYHTIHLCM